MRNRVGEKGARISKDHDRFCNDAAGQEWDNVVYAPGTYDSFIWNLQGGALLGVITGLKTRKDRLRYLDFACGTGRVLALLEPHVDEAVGLDISPSMLSRASQNVPRATLKAGDLLERPDPVGGDYDLITAFRFFLNTDAQRRLPILSSLASRLRDSDSYLVFNIHVNSYGIDGLRRRKSNSMSPRSVQRLISHAGLVLVDWYGFGLAPACREHLRMLRPWMRSIDRCAAGRPVIRRVSRDLLFVCRAMKPPGRRP